MARRFRSFRQLTQAAAFSLLAALPAIAPASRTACAALVPSPSPEPPFPAPAPPLAPPLPTPRPTIHPSSTPKPSAFKLQPFPATPRPTVHPSSTPKPKPKPDQWTEARRLFEQLSPDQQKKFLDNLDQWKNMPPEVQQLFRARELFQREKIAQEIDDAIIKSGLQLNEDQREVYALRYTQERRKIEDALRKEINQQRQSMVSDMLARLKLEFTPTPPPSIPPASPPSPLSDH